MRRSLNHILLSKVRRVLTIVLVAIPLYLLLKAVSLIIEGSLQSEALVFYHKITNTKIIGVYIVSLCITFFLSVLFSKRVEDMHDIVMKKDIVIFVLVSTALVVYLLYDTQSRDFSIELVAIFCSFGLSFLLHKVYENIRES